LGFVPNPDKTFNRGYTTYFLTGRGAEVTSPQSPKHVGEPLGRVASLGRDSFTLDDTAPLQSGDGITFYGRGDQLGGSTVNRVQGKTVFPQKLEGLVPGARVFRNHDHAFAKEIAQSRPVRKIAVALTLRERAEWIALEAVDEDGVCGEAALLCEKHPAEKPELARANAERSLAKLGDTEFVASSVTLAWTMPLHLPMAEVNSLRRKVVENLTAARVQARPVRRTLFVPNDSPFPATKLSYRANVLNQKAVAFYRRHQVHDIEPAAESGLDLGGRTVMTARYCLKYELGLCPRTGNSESTEKAEGTVPAQDPPPTFPPLSALSASSVSSPLPWFLVDDEGRRLRLHFHCDERHCTMEVVYKG
jgi:putative protease